MKRNEFQINGQKSKIDSPPKRSRHGRLLGTISRPDGRLLEARIWKIWGLS